MNKKQKAQKIGLLLAEAYPNPSIPLQHRNAHELLIATMLSAQTTDKKVNEVTPALFYRYPTIKDFAEADLEELKGYIKQIGLYNTKAERIIKVAKIIGEDFNGVVPDNMEDLLKLPGVARKTASVVLWQWFGKEEGFTVDTHVIRLANWFGLTEYKDAKRIEKDLMELFPRNEWGITSLRMILLGREVLTARNPQYQGTVWEELTVSRPN